MVWILAFAVILCIAVRIALNPLATKFARESLDRLEGYRGSVEKVAVSIIPLAVTVHGLTFDKLEEGGAEQSSRAAGKAAGPFVSVPEARLAVRFLPMLKGQLVAWLSVKEPRVTIHIERPLKETEDGKPEVPPPQPEIPDLSSELGKVIPFHVERIDLQGGEIRSIFPAAEGSAGAPLPDSTESGPDIVIRALELTVENLKSRSYIGEERPTTIAAHATVELTGKFTLFVTADLLAPDLTFAGQSALTELSLLEIEDVLAALADVKPKSGEVSLTTRFEVRERTIEGGVKPVLKNVELESSSPNIFVRLGTALADATIDLFSDRVPGREAMATVLPLRGKLTQPEVQLLPTLLGVVRNAFVLGLREGLANLPPPEAKEPQGALEQATHALSTEGGPPLAQPEGGKESEPAQGSKP
ncbi:MAG TPA: DUF748 domain-containing protein [Planctomycetota bacterium]|nr:DUF748 domain-containing protein [Planctomycetota bacterium]